MLSACPSTSRLEDVDAGNISDAGTVVVADAGAYPSMRTLTPEHMAQVLPKDAPGRPVLLDVGGTALVGGADRKNSGTSAARGWVVSPGRDRGNTGEIAAALGAKSRLGLG